MQRIKSAIVALAVAALVMSGVTVLTVAADVAQAPSASANTRGQCSGPRSVVAKTQTQLLANWQAEKITSQAALVAKSAGFSSVDENLKTWLTTRVVSAKLAKPATVSNYMCKNGKVIPAGKRTLPKGALVHVALPRSLSKADVRTTNPNAKGWKKVVLCVKFVAQASCSNPGKGTACVEVWVKAKVKVVITTPKPAVSPSPTPQPVTPVKITCAVNEVLNAAGNCVVQSNTSTQTAAVKQACEANTIWNGSQCVVNITQVTIQINANCSQIVFVGANNVIVNQEAVICSVVNTPPPVIVTPPPPPVVPPVVTPPAIQPPTIPQFREFNDLEVNWTSDHCVTVDFPAGHSGTVFWTATFGSFATPSKSVQDMTQICSVYKAPSEVPPGGHDRITVTATDTTTGLSVTKTSVPFVIHKTATPPL